jgi:hypothetical protein
MSTNQRNLRRFDGIEEAQIEISESYEFAAWSCTLISHNWITVAIRSENKVLASHNGLQCHLNVFQRLALSPRLVLLQRSIAGVIKSGGPQVLGTHLPVDWSEIFRDNCFLCWRLVPYDVLLASNMTAHLAELNAAAHADATDSSYDIMWVSLYRCLQRELQPRFDGK